MSEASQAVTELQLRSPRPRPPLRPPWGLLSEADQNLCMRALRGGCPPEDMHRLLIGVGGDWGDLSQSILKGAACWKTCISISLCCHVDVMSQISCAGDDLKPWFSKLVGCCRALNPATPGSLIQVWIISKALFGKH